MIDHPSRSPARLVACTESRRNILHDAAILLDGAYTCGKIKVRLLAVEGGTEYTYTGTPDVTSEHHAPDPTQRPPPATIPPGGVLLFSPLEERILAALADGQWHASGNVAAAINYPYGSTFKDIVTNLSERRAIETGRHGIRIPPPRDN